MVWVQPHTHEGVHRMTTLLAFDPAAERRVSDTGWAWGYFDDTTPFTLQGGGVIHGGFEGFCQWVREHKYPVVDTTIVEHFIMFNRKADPTPLLVEGVIRFRWPDTVLQPSTGKNTLVSDDELKAYGLWDTIGHHRDFVEASRHALVYLVKQRHVPTLRKLKA